MTVIGPRKSWASIPAIVPSAESLDLTGLPLARETLNKLFTVNRTDWYEETAGMAAFFQRALSALAKAYPTHKFTPVVMLTTESAEAKKEEGRAAGAKAWMVNASWW